MILKRLVAFPESRRILLYHLMATAFIVLQNGLMAMVPVLIRKYFHGGPWSTTLAASALIMGNLFSILWNEVYRRTTSRQYLLAIWVLAYVPMGGIAFCHNATPVMFCVFLSAIGGAAIQPLIGDILRSCYPPVVRSRVLGSIQSITQLSIMVSSGLVGFWLAKDDQAFRIYFPLGVGLMSAGVWLFWCIARQPLFAERSRHCTAEPLSAALKNAYAHMLEALARDGVFRRFELAYCSFNFAWLICVGLLPLLVTDVLKMDYGAVTLSSQLPLQLILVLGTVPMGFAMTRLGPIRMSIWALALLVLYPAALILAKNAWHVGVAISLLGCCLTVVNLAWTMGPVTLAQQPAQAPHYIAIHWTLTTLVGLAGQLSAVAYYRYTGNIRVPLAVAGLAYGLGAVLMYWTERYRRALQRAELAFAEGPSPNSQRPAISLELIADR